jgi:HSP20 family protein
MPIVPYRPFWDIDRWFEEHPFFSPHHFIREFEEMEPEEWFGGPRWGRFLPMIRTPRMDIYETDDKVVAEVELPGVDPKNVEVEVKDSVLRIKAKTEEKKEEKGKGYYRKEISAGYYKRAVPLPAEVVEEKAEASYEEGILKVVIPKQKPKREEKKPIKIKVKGPKTA